MSKLPLSGQIRKRNMLLRGNGYRYALNALKDKHAPFSRLEVVGMLIEAYQMGARRVRRQERCKRF